MLDTLVNLREMENLREVEIDPAKLTEARGQLTPGQVAHAVGISNQHLWNMENGKSKPSADVLIRLCLLYGKDCRFLANIELSALATEVAGQVHL
jgi:transcriptional regulator with XRE-family HTH domain